MYIGLHTVRGLIFLHDALECTALYMTINRTVSAVLTKTNRILTSSYIEEIV